MKFLILSSFLLSALVAAAQPPAKDAYNVVWTSQSKNASESMPCGGGDIGLNVWVENGALLFYLSRSGAFDESNAMLKQGRVRLKLSSDPFSGTDFRQELKLQEGYVVVSGGGVSIELWVDVYRPVVHVAIKSKKPVTVAAAYENWRYADRQQALKEMRGNSYKAKQPFPVITYKDEVTFDKDAVVFYHRNRRDVQDIFDYTVKVEQMETVKAQLFNPLKDLTSGGVMRGEGMYAKGVDSGSYAGTSFYSWSLQSKAPARSQQLEIGMHIEQAESVHRWKSGLDSVIQAAYKNRKTARAATEKWWQQFWDRSYIVIDNAADSLQAISRNYQLFRYQLGCNAYGKYPTRFNGGLFTFDPVYVDTQYHFTPDFRLWGGGLMTAQNQRLVYFPMLRNGDFDLLPSQLDYYLRMLKNAELRSQVYWNHGGACFTEQLENFGLPNVTEYGLKRPAGYDAGIEYNAWLEYQWETVFEFCLMMLELERYEGRDIHAYIPFIESCLQFYDEHYQYLARKLGARIWDENGKYVFYPSSAAETFKMAYNSTTVIAALRVTLGRLLELPEQYLDSARRGQWKIMLQRIPELPYRQVEGHTMLSPAVTWARVQNSEAPQLYPVYPWGIYGVGKPGLDTALNTWNYDPHVVKYRSHVGWRQYNIFAARLGLREEAGYYAALKFANGRHRFPSFWGPGFDWTPDHNWGGAAMIGLQEMLVQTDGKKIYLLPAWPEGWNARFKLHAPYNTVIEGAVKDGKLQRLQVTPAKRQTDVIFSYQNK
ncbi:DUF5703 domain-containing protein [Filimonas effusa]|uniref:DUF5703 domain-containing protein n=1 Tax=Filimonas effusa TaxID=2508721 RepID=A0A4Q1DCZ3_9BACT|nr:DUF5703 domain-containing protein [Filimonas effusa]RXK86735.1 hypothetical protein ESB13_08010 [Filimonas effusa]